MQRELAALSILYMQGTYNPWLVYLSIAVAIVVCYTASNLAARVYGTRLRRGIAWLAGGMLALGTGIWAMHQAGVPDLRAVSVSTDDRMLLMASIVVAILASCAALWLSFRLRRDRDDAIDAHVRNSNRCDSLTGLPNRVALVAAAEQALADARRRDTQLAVMVLDVDRLKAINDSLGHQAGDELLLELSQRLRSVLRHNDTLARLASDEFTILATELRSARDAETVAEKVLEALHQKFTAGTVDVHPSVSIGISTFPMDGDSFDILLRRANAAMRYTKDSARGGYRFYAAEMSTFTDDRLALESELRRAIDRGEMELHYQPKVDIPTDRVRSAEALIRWRHPTRGLISPLTFIPIAEETGLIVPLGEWVLRAACRQIRTWLDAGLSPVRVAVNLSAKQFRQADLAAMVKSALEESRLEPGSIELELTESAIMHNPEASAATLATLSAMGVHISIDDFGTGYSSLSYLRRFPLDKLKIDRSFIRDLMKNSDDASIVKAIISLAHNLRLRVVAEGVESSDQLEFLRQLGCDQYQGFYCSPAVPAEDFANLVRRMRPEREFTEADMLRTQSRLSAFTPEPVA
ncbi:MAG TPA: EAL domain-containing protein [Povalibacter sp.]|nr:EAL domain-containing protein [Povalibacter sp.]